MGLEEDRLLAALNPPQRDAVTHRGGPLLVLAGAGSGKTRVITYRIAHLLARGEASPWNILAVTFTNKAAREMRERIWGLLGRSEGDLWISTFHSTCARVLRGHAHLLGYQRDFAIYDERDQMGVMEECLREVNLDPKRFPPRQMLWRIRDAKQRFVGPEEALRLWAGDYLGERTARVYEEYQRRLLSAQAMDFDDLLFLTLRLWETHPEILEYYRGRWRHVLVDEFQDTNRIQYLLVKRLAEQHGNICVVGDDDQSIYSWRGADLANILQFEEDFPRTRVIRLEQNYRSTRTILEASGAVIQRNRMRKGKRLWTDNEQGEPVRLYCALDEREEASFVAQEICHLVEREGVRPGEMAVFYRVHAQSRVLEEELLRRRIPFAIYGGVGFYERKEIKDLVAYLRAMIHPGDDLSWIRILNTPRRGIGPRTVESVRALARREGIPFSQALRRFTQDRKSRGSIAPRICRFLGVMDALASQVHQLTVAELVRKVLETTGYLEELERDSDPRSRDRMENIQEFLNLVEEYGEEGEEETGLSGFLERLALINDLDRMEDGEERVSLMTLHGAKGLEFPVVFMVGLEEGLFPHSLSLEDEAALEEERRLCYVGMTRAQRRLYLTHSATRLLWGARRVQEPSRFLAEIPEGCLLGGSPQGPSLEAVEERGLYVGRWVRHRAFGVGSVQEILENGTRVVVHFPGVGMKRFLVDQAPLEWL